MRVVFTGITGLGKEKIAKAVAIEAAKKRGLIPDLDDSFTKKFIQVLSVEDEIKNTLGDIRPFLDQFLPRERQRRWNEAMDKLLKRVGEAEHTVLCFHNVFYRRSNFFACTDWDLLASYRPTVFVTLINDIYDIWETINARERELASNSYLHLPEILAWRSAEISATESLAENLYAKGDRHGISEQDISSIRKNHPNIDCVLGTPIPHLVFAVKHPLRTLYQLLFRRDLLVTYASFPITKTRDDPVGRSEIDSYRKRLFESNFLTVLDPLTIDELRFPKQWSPNEPPLLQRWPLNIGPPMVNDVPMTQNPFSGYDQLQIDSFKTSVARHIEARDYRMVAQTNVVAAYRPFYGGPLGSGVSPSDKPSGGVDKELMFALAENKLVYAVHPEQDQLKGPQVFSSGDLAVATQDVDELLAQLKKVQDRRSPRMMEHHEAKTWE